MMKRILVPLIALLVVLGAIAAPPSRAALIAASNYTDQNGWHVGGVLEVLSTGTLRLDTGTKTTVAVAGAATLNKLSGSVTSESLTTAAAATYTLTVTDSRVLATDIPFASVALGTSTTGLPDVTMMKAGAGVLTITVQNASPSAAFNGTIVVSFGLIKA